MRHNLDKPTRGRDLYSAVARNIGGIKFATHPPVECCPVLGDNWLPATFQEPDGYLSFISRFTPFLAAMAREGRRSHGPGVVMLRQEAPSLVRACYATVAEPGRDYPPMRDCNPETEVVAVVTDDRDGILWHWKIAAR